MKGDINKDKNNDDEIHLSDSASLSEYSDANTMNYPILPVEFKSLFLAVFKIS